MKIKWKVVSAYTGIEEDAPANNAGSGNVSMPPDAVKKKKKQTLIDRNGKIDGRSKSYREHRAKLEASRKKRLERKSSAGSKFIENIKKKTAEMAYTQGIDTMKPVADMSNNNLQASKKKKKK
jgi:hypothetical protein